jgi:hypothetical protein
MGATYLYDDDGIYETQTTEIHMHGNSTLLYHGMRSCDMGHEMNFPLHTGFTWLVFVCAIGVGSSRYCI